MRVQVRLGPGLSRVVGRPRLAADLPEEASLEDLLGHLGELHPELAGGLDSALPVVRGAHASVDEPLRDGDEVALLIPVAGGCAPRAVPGGTTRSEGGWRWP